MGGNAGLPRKIVDKVGDKVVDRAATAIAAAVLLVLLGIAGVMYSLVLGHTQEALLVALVVSVLFNIYLYLLLRGKREFQRFKGMNIFWLCNDMRYTQGMLEDSPKEFIINGLRRTHHHIKEAGLGDALERKSRKLIEDVLAVETMGDRNSPMRDHFKHRVLGLFDEVANELKRRQPDFKPDPE